MQRAIPLTSTTLQAWIAVGLSIVIVVGFASLSTAGAVPGIRDHVDPATGGLVPVPMEPAPPRPTDMATSRSHEGLVEEPAPGGGIMVDLKGRFHVPLVAGPGGDGGSTAGRAKALQDR